MSNLHCPQCQSTIEQDFGVITCGHCGAVLMVDIEGHIQLSDEAQNHQAPSPIPSDSFEAPPVGGGDHEVQADLAQYEGYESIEAPEMNQPIVEPGHPQDFSTILEESQVSEAHPKLARDFKDEILDFANSDLHTGPLSYTLYVSNIDSGELRSALREVLGDSKFNLEVEEIMKSIRSGKLVLENLNPVKTTLLVQRLRRFPFEISWRQHAFS